MKDTLQNRERAGPEATPSFEGVVVQWCNPLILQPEQSRGVGLIAGRAPPIERHDRSLQTPLALSYLCNLSAWR